MQKLMFIAVLWIACIQAASVCAQTEGGQTRKLEPIVIQGRSGNEAPNAPYHLPESAEAATWSIDQNGIQALEPRDVFDVLSYAPGVQLSFQGRKGMNFISSRGGGTFTGGSSFAVLIDGIYVPWTQSSRMLASFPVDAIESIKVVRDSTILTLAPLTGLGSKGAAVQGVIIIKTRKPEKNESQIKASYGNLNRSKIFLNHADRFDTAYYSLNYNRLNDDGRDDWNNASNSDSILLKGGYDNNGLKTDASFYYDWASREIQRATSVSKTSDSRWEYDPLDTLMATANVAKQWNAGQTTSLGLYTSKVDATAKYRSYSKPTYSEHDPVEKVIHADLSHIINTDRNNFRIGGQAIFWDCPHGQFYYENVEREEELYSSYVHDEYSISEAWSIDAGARIDYKHISKGINKYDSTDATPTDLISDKWADPYYSVAAGTSYKINEIWQASFRANYVEQGADSFLVAADDKTLNPEKQWRYEAGVIARLHPSVQAAFTAFYYDIADMKQAVGSIKVDGDVISVYDNADTVRKGIELDFTGYILTPDLNYEVNYSYQRSNNDIDDEAIPHHIASLRLGYRMMPFQCNVMWRWVSEYESNQFAVQNLYYEIGDFSRLDANISYDFTVGKSQIRATLFGQNLTDEEYETRLGWKDVGLTYGVELGFKF